MFEITVGRQIALSYPIYILTLKLLLLIYRSNFFVPYKKSGTTYDTHIVFCSSEIESDATKLLVCQFVIFVAQ